MPKDVELTAFSCYTTYLALKMHFQADGKYDYHRYKGRVRAKFETFEKRRDVKHFIDISRHRAPIEFLISNFIFGNNGWIGDFDEANYLEFKKFATNGFYMFQQDLKHFNKKNFLKNFSIVDGVPPAFQMYADGKISLFTLIVFSHFLNFEEAYKGKDNLVLFEDEFNRVIKSQNFFDIDKSKYKQLILNTFAR